MEYFLLFFFSVSSNGECDLPEWTLHLPLGPFGFFAHILLLQNFKLWKNQNAQESLHGSGPQQCQLDTLVRFKIRDIHSS